ncbi:hypothetical protein EYF80_044958 [Liparis tanakae]|uniref:Uncharacterized protein n=1 Tax=Liparis tanakae TaxID=230148 RepID=A0A4Z2FVD4_9TELE|nr:hypothetical protein EYF80_044958 [Liparis tanakae]
MLAGAVLALFKTLENAGRRGEGFVLPLLITAGCLTAESQSAHLKYWEYDRLPVHQPAETLWGEGERRFRVASREPRKTLKI